MDACLRLLLHKEGAALADSLEESWLGVAAAAAKLERVYAKAHPGAEVREGELLAFLRFLRGAGGAADVPCAVRALHMLTRSPCAVAGIGAEPEARSFRQTVLAHAREAFVATVPPPRVLASMLKTASPWVEDAVLAFECASVSEFGSAAEESHALLSLLLEEVADRCGGRPPPRVCEALWAACVLDPALDPLGPLLTPLLPWLAWTDCNDETLDGSLADEAEERGQSEGEPASAYPLSEALDCVLIDDPPVPVPVPRPRCSEGHLLTRTAFHVEYGAYSDGYQCNLCARHSSSAAMAGGLYERWCCRSCEFDVCLDCAPPAPEQSEGRESACGRGHRLGRGEAGAAFRCAECGIACGARERRVQCAPCGQLLCLRCRPDWPTLCSGAHEMVVSGFCERDHGCGSRCALCGLHVRPRRQRWFCLACGLALCFACVPL